MRLVFSGLFRKVSFTYAQLAGFSGQTCTELEEKRKGILQRSINATWSESGSRFQRTSLIWISMPGYPSDMAISRFAFLTSVLETALLLTHVLRVDTISLALSTIHASSVSCRKKQLLGSYLSR